MNTQTTGTPLSGQAKPKVGQAPAMMAMPQSARYGLQEVTANGIPLAKLGRGPMEQALQPFPAETPGAFTSFGAPNNAAQASPVTFLGWDMKFITLVALLLLGIVTGLVLMVRAQHAPVYVTDEAPAAQSAAEPTASAPSPAVQPAAATSVTPAPATVSASAAPAANPETAAAPQHAAAASSNTPQELLSVIGRE